MPRRYIQWAKEYQSTAKEIGDRALEERAYGNLGNAYHWLGNFQKAIDCQKESQSFAKDVRDRSLEGTASGNLSNASCLCNFQRATEFHKQHLSIAKEVGDRAAEGHVYGNLDNAYRCVCDFNPKIIPLRKSCSAALRNSILSFILEGWLLRDMMFSWTNHSAQITVTEDDLFQQRLPSQIYNLKNNFYSSIIPRNINVYNTK